MAPLHHMIDVSADDQFDPHTWIATLDESHPFRKRLIAAECQLDKRRDQLRVAYASHLYTMDKYRYLHERIPEPVKTMITMLLLEHDFDSWEAADNGLFVTFAHDSSIGIIEIVQTEHGYDICAGYRSIPSVVGRPGRNIADKTLRMTPSREVHSIDDLCSVVREIMAVLPQVVSAYNTACVAAKQLEAVFAAP